VIDEPFDMPAAVLAAQKCSVDVGFAMACEDRTGALLRTLAASKPGGRILELGTGTGVGTAWLLAGMDPTARLTTVEVDWATHAVACGVIGDDPRAELVLDDAHRWLTAYDGPPFDLAYVDCRPGKFLDRRLLLAQLAPGALYVGDDLLPQPTWPADHQPRVDAFLADIVAEPDLVVTLMRWSSGLVVAARRSVRDGVDEPAGALAEQVGGDVLTDRGSLEGRPGPAGLQGGGAVRAVHRTPQRQLPVGVEDGVPGDRAVAVPAQRPQHGPFRSGGPGGLLMVEPLGQGSGRGVIGADLQRDDAGPDRRDDRLDGEYVADAVGVVDAVQAGHGQDQRIDFAAVQLGQAGVDVAAHRRELQVWPVAGQLGPAPHRAGAHRGVGGQVGELAPVCGDHAVVDVLAVEVCGERQAVGDRYVAGDVLQAVHREVDLTGQQRPVDLPDERALATRGGQRPHPLIAMSGDRDQLARCGQHRSHPTRLRQRHWASPGADPYGTSLSAHGGHSTTVIAADDPDTPGRIACCGHGEQPIAASHRGWSRIRTALDDMHLRSESEPASAYAERVATGSTGPTVRPLAGGAR